LAQLSSALAFDLGVYMSVIGITLVLLREFSTPPESAREEAP